MSLSEIGYEAYMKDIPQENVTPVGIFLVHRERLIVAQDQDVGQVEIQQSDLIEKVIPIQTGWSLIHFLGLSSNLCHQQRSFIEFHRYIPFAFIVISWHTDIFICVSANASKLLHLQM